MGRKKKKVRATLKLVPKPVVRLTLSKIEKIWLRDNKRCFWCGKELGWEHGKCRPTKDHILPVSKGGPNARWNLVCSCADCNAKKGDWLINPITNQVISPTILWVFLRD